MQLLRNLIVLALLVSANYVCLAVDAQNNVQAVSQMAGNKISVSEWFSRYDNIRHKAQMSPAERQRADALMAKGFSVLVKGDTKVATRNLLIQLVGRYKNAIVSLNALPRIPETLPLHKGYYQYFLTAYQLFSDYLKVQDNLLATDPRSGEPIATGLVQRKKTLELLERSVKELDQNIRMQYGIAPYPY